MVWNMLGLQVLKEVVTFGLGFESLGFLVALNIKQVRL